MIVEGLNDHNQDVGAFVVASVKVTVYEIGGAVLEAVKFATGGAAEL